MENEFKNNIITRRDFLRSSAAAAGLAAGALGGTKLAFAGKRAATDWVTLGNSGILVTRLAMGTGGNGGSLQREMGQAAFTRVVRHAYDRGIRFFESADAYGEQYGFDRAAELVRVACAEESSADGILDRILETVKAFRGSEPQMDDVTCVVLKITDT